MFHCGIAAAVVVDAADMEIDSMLNYCVVVIFAIGIRKQVLEHMLDAHL